MSRHPAKDGARPYPSFQPPGSRSCRAAGADNAAQQESPLIFQNIRSARDANRGSARVSARRCRIGAGDQAPDQNLDVTIALEGLTGHVCGPYTRVASLPVFSEGAENVLRLSGGRRMAREAEERSLNADEDQNALPFDRVH